MCLTNIYVQFILINLLQFVLDKLTGYSLLFVYYVGIGNCSGLKGLTGRSVDVECEFTVCWIYAARVLHLCGLC